MHSARTHLLALTALCAVVYFAGLTTHGLTNWQEGQRALVARDMHAQGSWIVPTVNGRPYLAKPPMIYWAQLALAGGSQPSEFHLRLTVALAGLAGVLGTYFVARRNLPGGVARSPMGKTARSEARDGAPGEFGAWSAGNMALWSAALLATGILYVRSSRIGELDILLVPFTVAAIGGVYAAWARHLDKGRTHWWAVALAAIAAAGAGLSKGPPAILVIALGAYGGIALWAAFSPEAGGGRGGRLGACFRSYARTHPVAVLGLPFLALWLWGRAVAARVGPEVVAGFARGEAEDNLRLFVPQAPMRNLETVSYAVGLGSLFALVAVVWLIIARPRIPRGWYMVFAWVGLSLIAFSVLGKGVPRYLTPVWPGIAMLGGIGVAAMLGRMTRPARLARPLAAAVVVLGLGQGLWYGYGREHGLNLGLVKIPGTPQRCPRALIAQLRALDGPALAALDIWTPALDYYAGRHVQPYEDVGPPVGLAGVHPRPIAELLEELTRTGGSRTLLVRATPHPGIEAAPPIDRLIAMGFIVETVPTTARFRVDNQRTPVIAVRVSASPDVS